MITVYNAMLVMLGCFMAALVVLFVMPAYRRRIERFTMERMKRALPLTEAEIRADKDRLRAEFATETHKLEMKLEEASLSAARQSVEINRREARIHDLEMEISSHKTSIEENENARRVLEQAIMDRLPKVEQRLTEARRMLQQRDDEIATLAKSSGKQAAALEQATQLNAQLGDEVSRLRTTLNTRAARNRDALGDARFDGEVALRSEVESLRAKSREQAQLIEKLQSEVKRAEGERVAEIDKLKSALTKAEGELEKLVRGGSEDTPAAARIRELENAGRAYRDEIERLQAELSARNATSSGGEAGGAAQAEIAVLKAEIDEQRRTIALLKSEAAANSERLARQAEHFRDEVRRLSTSAPDDDVTTRRTRTMEAARRSLAARISEPRVPRPSASEDASSKSAEAAAETPRQAPYLKAVNGGAQPKPDEASEAEAENRSSESVPRRSRLLERIQNIDKSG